MKVASYRPLDPVRTWLQPPRLFWTVTLAAVWTGVVWSNRIGLITSAEAENGWAVARIVGSLVIAVLLGVVAWRIRRNGTVAVLDRIVLVGFLLWNLAVWVPSLIDVLPGDYSIPFKIVHAVLAGGSMLLGALLFGAARTRARPG